jgi:hypothetical protein
VIKKANQMICIIVKAWVHPINMKDAYYASARNDITKGTEDNLNIPNK